MAGTGRVVVRGKFLWLGEEKFYVRGVTYGTFARDEDGDQFPSRETAERDFAAMAANGINAVRTYTVPPTWLLDLAHAHDLRVMVGISWEDHVAFLESRANRESIVRRVQEATSATAGHPAVLCHAIGNEIPSQIARWYGDRKVERFLSHLYGAVKAEDPDALVTYVNYPSTEYLELPFLDFASFNIYLESQERLEEYLARLHNIVGDMPLVVAECGFDSYRNGADQQAAVLGWQIDSVFRAGSAGCFVFAWTDEWHRGGFEIEDWDFGLTDRRRRPKPALAAVRDAYARLPLAPAETSPRVSVVVCCRNEEAHLGRCLQALDELVYPDFEVIVVDDGSTDGTVAVAEQFDVRLVSTENRGLAAARNLGLELATGEIVAYIDGDAWPDPHWLSYLVAAFEDSDHVGIGGPNLPPPDAGPVAQCVANAPGGPTHVLVSDAEAEHIPGCNMAFRKDALEAIGGFDPQFRAAGDDVDICWQLQGRGWTLGFNPTAVVWHLRRNTVRGFWRQQVGYGKAEALLERKWPEKYNATGHVTWAGRLYAKGVSNILYGARSSIYYGVWGTGLFQWRHGGAGRMLRSLPLMPEWYLLVLLLAQISALGFVWHPFLFALPLLGLGLTALLVQAGTGAAHATFSRPSPRSLGRTRLRLLTAFLYLAQPVARLSGRLRNGLTVWRRRNSGLVLPTLVLAEVCVLGAVWRPLLFVFPALAISFGALVYHTRFGKLARTEVAEAVVAPVRSRWARFVWRLRAALTPLPPGRSYGKVLPIPRTLALWDEEWRSTSQRLTGVESGLRSTGTVFRHGGGFDRWDVEVRGGIFGGARMRSAIEEHGGGRQLVRFRVWPRATHFADLALLSSGIAFVWAAAVGHRVLTGIFIAVLLIVGLRVMLETSSALGALLPALRHTPKADAEPAVLEPKPVLRLVVPEPATAEGATGEA
jgi:GT2 family glycosyltransferase